MYEKSVPPPRVIDLSGGQPDLTPEWIPWMMEELRRRELDACTYLWSDDNLSNDYFWRYLTSVQIDLIRGYRNYGKVCCFKGFNAESFAFNTGANSKLFDRQFELFGRHLGVGIDLYAYATFTAPNGNHLGPAMKEFVNRLQSLHPNLPLRTVPLEIKSFSPTKGRTVSIHESAIHNQQEAIRIWNQEIQNRFSEEERRIPIHEVRVTAV
jgi:uncharacterized Fe-S cluster-containing radical SAM superfamily protein